MNGFIHVVCEKKIIIIMIYTRKEKKLDLTMTYYYPSNACKFKIKGNVTQKETVKIH